jgi:hypothetical protein
VLAFFLLGGLALPAALLENFHSVARGQGATLILQGRKMC